MNHMIRSALLTLACGAPTVLSGQRQVLPVARRLQTVRRNKPQRRRIDAVAKPRGPRPVRKDVAKVRIAVRGPHFGALHEQRAIGLLLDVARLERPREARPSGAGIVFVERAEQRLAGYDVHVDPVLMIVPVLVLEGTLGS